MSRQLFVFFSLAVLITLSGSVQAMQSAEAVTTDAVSISIHGIGPGVDQNAYRKVRKIIGQAVVDGVVDKFLIQGYGIEGGFSGCVKAGQFTNARTFKRFFNSLKIVRYNRATTAYDVSYTDACSESPSNPAISKVNVFKYDESLQCENHGGIPLSSMQAELEMAGIAVYSAQSKPDGLIRITLCGTDTGMMNVYQIAETDLQNAQLLGFSVLNE